VAARSDGERRAVSLDRLDSGTYAARTPDVPTAALPGSAEKARVMELRVRSGQAANHPEDLRDGEDTTRRLEMVQARNSFWVPTGRVVPTEQPREGSGQREGGRRLHRPAGFPARLKALREARGLTQKALAARAKVSTPHLCFLELGKRVPRLGVLVALADALRVTLDDLAGRRPPA
jgi:DNA-binding XRE family transcriptional regulator